MPILSYCNNPTSMFNPYFVCSSAFLAMLYYSFFFFFLKSHSVSASCFIAAAGIQEEILLMNPAQCDSTDMFSHLFTPAFAWPAGSILFLLVRPKNTTLVHPMCIFMKPRSRWKKFVFFELFQGCAKVAIY